jgi:hypothetical protein
MTASQADCKFDEFAAVFSNNGVEHTVRVRFTPFKEAKKWAVEMLSNQLERHHGRGEHTVSLFGVNFEDVRSEHEKEVGFPMDMQPVRGELLFSL